MLELLSQIGETISGVSSIPEVLLFIKKANETFQKIKEQPSLNGISVSERVHFERGLK
ncbi:hypothetical protein [Flavobacterium sp. 83]|uniref:hypothetical protein n=1 Tax=Flavobacterium sp. 83 TaxID=1131812 RepID=UPI000A4136B7